MIKGFEILLAKYFVTFILVAYSSLSKAQDVYPLHPSVGDTINIDEKLDYSLFSNIENEGFNFACIKFISDEFVLVINYNDSSTKLVSDKSVKLSQPEIIEEQQKIQKVNAYYKYLAEEAKKPKPKEDFKVLEKKIPVRFEGPIAEKMKKEARMKSRLMEDQRMMNDFEMGLRPREMRLEFGR